MNKYGLIILGIVSIIIVSIILAIGIGIFGIITLSNIEEYNKYKNEMTLYKGTIYYTDNISKLTARKIINYFNNLSKVKYTVFADKTEDGRYEIKITTVFENKDDISELKKVAFDWLASDLAKKLDKPVILKVINDKEEVLYTTAG